MFPDKNLENIFYSDRKVEVTEFTHENRLLHILSNLVRASYTMTDPFYPDKSTQDMELDLVMHKVDKLKRQFGKHFQELNLEDNEILR